MSTKGKVKNRVLQIRFSFGREKTGSEFKTTRKLNDYVCKDFGSGLDFSQNNIPNSPYVRKVGKVKRDANWNKQSRVAELISELHTSTTSKLHYGFCTEHGNSFFCIILAHLSVHGDSSIFLPALNDPSNNALDNDVITREIIAVYMRTHRNDLPGSPMPETRKYPHTNESMVVTPPSL